MMKLCTVVALHGLILHNGDQNRGDGRIQLRSIVVAGATVRLGLDLIEADGEAQLSWGYGPRHQGRINFWTTQRNRFFRLEDPWEC